MNDTNDVFKFSPDNLKQKQRELKNKKNFKLNDGNYNEYVEFILNFIFYKSIHRKRRE